ncbi:hypothetical protein [Nonomuraea diastatica]|uniref:Transposase n=1 Tax=Nonomuraea diastatica TaxID=1848329 RepID=A0A4R4VN88_9ACTN|nr:hypothetical protein [Nonomuraea diastatica]TDD07162.1 hypothetical protein E1294_48400 [Nonomuraea diastatica]
MHCQQGRQPGFAHRFQQRCFRNFDLRRHTYEQVKAACGLAAQPAQHVMKKVCDAYRTLHANLAAGNLGKPGSARRVKAESKPISFRPGAAQPYDDRCLSWQHGDRTVSIWTVAGRLRGIAFTGSARQLALLAAHRKGESDLVWRDGMWFLHATVDVPDIAATAPHGFRGVDLGIADIATTSDAARYSGKRLNAVRPAIVSCAAACRPSGPDRPSGC